MAPQLAWIGLGNMGRAMCKKLVEKGNLDKPLILFNRTQKRADDLSKILTSEKSTVASKIESVVSVSDIIFICVEEDTAVNEIVDACLKNDVKGKLFVDCSTIHPDTTEAVAKKITTKGGHFVAAPVFGVPAVAEAGNLVFVLAGPIDDVEKVRPYTKDVMGRVVIDFGGQACGQASKMKIVGNTFMGSMVETLSAGHVLAEKSGLGTENLHQFIESVFSGPYSAYSRRMISGDYYMREEPLVSVSLARKDVKHALDLAKSSGARMRIVEIMDDHLAKVMEHQGRSGDVAGVYGVIRQEGNLKYENQN